MKGEKIEWVRYNEPINPDNPPKLGLYDKIEGGSNVLRTIHVSEAIAIEKEAVKRRMAYLSKFEEVDPNHFDFTDEQLLDDFIITNWAWVVADPNDPS